MKTKKMAVALAVLLGGLVATESAFAWRGHRGHSRLHLGIVIGAPIVSWHSYHPRPYHYPAYYPAYYPPYYPAPVIVPAQPTVYIERDSQPSVQPSTQPQGYWFYCADARAYYPYVKECPGGWQRVAPQPQG